MHKTFRANILDESGSELYREGSRTKPSIGRDGGEGKAKAETLLSSLWPFRIEKKGDAAEASRRPHLPVFFAKFAKACATSPEMEPPHRTVYNEISIKHYKIGQMLQGSEKERV